MTPIPLTLIQAGRDLTEPTISPDGRWVAFVQRWNGASSINRVALEGGPEEIVSFGPQPVPGRGTGGGCFTWVAGSDGRISIVYCAADGELWRQDGTQLERVTSHGRSVRAPAVAVGDPTEDRRHLVADILVYSIDEAEIWIFDLASGDGRRLDDGRHAFCFDPAISPDGRHVSWQGWSPPDMPWDGAQRVDLDLASGAIEVWRLDDAAVQQPRFTPRGERVHVHDGSGWMNVHVENQPIVSEECEQAGPTWGMGNRSYAVDPRGERVAFTRNEKGFGALCVADLAAGSVEQLGRGVHGHLSWAGDHVVALRSGARTPPQIVAYDGSRSRSTIAVSQPASWPTEELPEPELVEATSSIDGLVVHARRYVAGRGRMLVQVHGGPTDQWQVDWRPRIVYWWSRGWDVLVVDPRGTTGHGRRYQQALHGMWGRGDVDDTAHLVAYAHARGWATPSSTAMLGGSSGGLTVLGMMADHRGLVAGGVASYPVSDLEALTEATHRFEAHYTETLVAPADGSDESRARFEELSPLFRAASITKPLLVFHGSDDPVVPVGQSRTLAKRIRDAGGDVELVVYEGEGHGFRDPDIVSDEYERTEAFLDALIPPDERGLADGLSAV